MNKNIDLTKIKDRFNPNTLKSFDQVLTQKDGIWSITFFFFFNETDKICICTAFGDYKYCIPYNDDTKHLVGTTKEAPEFYRYWED